jgi:hypothetical protein
VLKESTVNAGSPDNQSARTEGLPKSIQLLERRQRQRIVVLIGSAGGYRRKAKVQRMNWRRGFFRIWVVFSILWIGGVAYLDHDQVCARYSPAERRQNANDPRRNSDGTFNVKPGELFPHGDMRPPNCFLVSDEARPDWDTRFPAILGLLKLPLVLLVGGLILGWVARGFRSLRGSN